MSETKNRWNSSLVFILAIIGCAVGLGNIWRYPYILYTNGGGVFFIAYIIATLVLGIPFLILETGMGYNFSSSFPKTSNYIDRKYQLLGWIMPLTEYLLMTYYMVLIGWNVIYFALSFFKSWGADPSTYFTSTLVEHSFTVPNVASFIPILVMVVAITWFFLWFVSHRNLESGVGRISKIFVPLLFLTTCAIVAYTLTLPGASIGLNGLFTVDWSRFSDFHIWMAAFGQVIFSLSIGSAAMFTYSCYVDGDTDIISNSFIIVIANGLFENFSAIGVFSVLGYMSLEMGIPLNNLVQEGTSLAFIIYPTVFNILGDIGFILGPLFFFSVCIAGFTSALSMIEPLSFSIQNKFALTRSKTTLLLCLVGFIASLMYSTTHGLDLLGNVDIFLNDIVILIGIVFECILFAWVFKADSLIALLNKNSKYLKVGRIWLFTIRYLLPVIISIVWLGGMYKIFTSSSVNLVFVIIAGFAIMIAISLAFTLLPPKSEDWEKIDTRI